MSVSRRPSSEEHSRQQKIYFETSGYRTLKPTRSPYLRRHVEMMMRLAHIEPGQRVLEVGCGMGRYTVILKELGVEVEGLDLSLELLNKLQDHAGDRYHIPIHAMDLIDAPHELKGRFDAVIGFFVLHHVHDVAAAIKAAASLSKPRGIIGFLEPNPLNLLYYLQILATPGMRWGQEKGMLRMSPGGLLPMLDDAGVEAPFFKRFGFFPPFITNRSFGLSLEAAFERAKPLAKIRPFQIFGGTIS